MIRAIDEYKITGLSTTLPFCKYVMQHEAFTSGHFDTNFVAKYFNPKEQKEYSENEKSHKIAAALTNALISSASGPEKIHESNGQSGKSKSLEESFKRNYSMPEIRPVKAWRYNRDLAKDMDSLTSPLFDVVSDKQREKLYLNQYNSIHLSVPKGDQPFESAARLFSDWKLKGIIEKDQIPGIYVYYQYFSIPGSNKEYCRKGFVCNIKAHYWEENKILRHENTIPDSVNDRIQLLETTQLNVSPTHGLYKDNDFVLEKYMDESMQSPIYETEDYQGVRDVLSVIHDKKVIEQFQKNIKGRNIILADGHHRYESSLAYRKKMEEQNPNHTGEEAYNFHLMYLTNSSSDHLMVLPTHRLIKGLENFDKDCNHSKAPGIFYHSRAGRSI